MKKIMIILGILAAIQSSYAQTVSKERATRIALLYASTSKCESAPINVRSLDAQAAIDTSNTFILSVTNKAPLYVVQMEDGWVLVSSELAAIPILASAPTGKFPDVEDMPDGMKWLLSYYESAIQYARDSLPNNVVDEKWLASTEYPSRDGSSNILSRMGLVHWNQNDNNGGYAFCCGKTYNKFCPIGLNPQNHCGHTYVGCDAVAMAQVMWYWQWPYFAKIPDIPNNVNGSKHICEYNWDVIPTEIYDYTEMLYVDAVASLLRDCGYANNTQFGDSGSASNLNYCRTALKNIFHYKSSIQLQNKSGNNWISKLKNEIDAGRPVLYRGEDAAGNGHAFILFGYDSNDYFRINWGWGGVGNNGTFSLNPLEFNDSTSLNMGQAALFNIEPNYPDCGSHSLTIFDYNDNPFDYYYGGAITIKNKTIGSNKSGVIYSGEEVRLQSTCTISAGANIHIAIRDMHCGESDRGNLLLAPGSQDSPTSVDQIKDTSFFSITPNPVLDQISISYSEPLAKTTIYNLSGQLILQATETEINVSALPAGVYVVHAKTSTGQLLQSKFVKL